MCRMIDRCARCGAQGRVFPLDRGVYCLNCCELSFRNRPRWRGIERRDPRREPRGYGRRWTDVLAADSRI